MFAISVCVDLHFAFSVWLWKNSWCRHLSKFRLEYYEAGSSVCYLQVEENHLGVSPLNSIFFSGKCLVNSSLEHFYVLGTDVSTLYLLTQTTQSPLFTTKATEAQRGQATFQSLGAKKWGFKPRSVITFKYYIILMPAKKMVNTLIGINAIFHNELTIKMVSYL